MIAVRTIIGDLSPVTANIKVLNIFIKKKNFLLEY